MLLDQSKFRERFDEIKAILGLTDVDCKKIFTVNRLENKEGRSFFREVFIRRGSTSGVYGVEEPHECYMTYTTERAEKEALKLYKRELKCSHQEAIERYCWDWDASGIGKSLAFAQKVNEAGKVLNLRGQQPDDKIIGNGRSSERRVPNSFGLSRVTSDEDEVNGGWVVDTISSEYYQ